MARKNLLKGLMEEPETSDTVLPSAPHRRTKGAIGAVSRSIADLKSRSVVDLDPFDIMPGGLDDRLEHDEADHARLMESLASYGQQVPILVRPDPASESKYQIVYGRRRVLAMRDLKQPVKAMIRDLDDAELIMAQGQENTARRDLSFIERVNFARQMLEAGYDRKIIADALSTDKTLISRMISVSEDVPVEVIEIIGAAPGTGRDKWLTFARLWSGQDRDLRDAIDVIASSAKAETSDQRFAALLDWLKGTKPRAVAVSPAMLLGAEGVKLGQLKRGKKRSTFEIDAVTAPGFDTWLAEQLPLLHRDWLKKKSAD